MKENDFERILQQKDKQIAALLEENNSLREKLELALKARYSKTSEKMKPEILPELDEPQVTAEEAAEIAEAEQEIAVKSYGRKKPKRKPIPAEYPRETVIHDIPIEQQVCNCGNNLHCIGEDIHEQLEYIPAKIKVIQHVRKKYGCRSCETGISMAPATIFLPKILAGPGLLSHVILSKYEDHSPLYRQEKIWQRLGIDIARQTLCNWVLLAAERLQVLVDLLREELLQLNYVRADETPVQVMEEKKVRASKRAYMWVFCSGRTQGAICVYQFATTRAGIVPQEFLGGFKGFLQTDEFSGYNKLNVTRVGCMAHARRKFAVIAKSTKKTGSSHYAVAIIAKLYKIEKKIKELKLNDDETTTYRQENSKPILIKFKNWLDQQKLKVPPKSPLGKAIHYFFAHWDNLTIYLKHGFLDIDNNFTEQKVKPFTLGRKNWLFMGNERGGQAAAVLFSLIESAKANHLNTFAYLRYVMDKLPSINSGDHNKLLQLLPHKLDPSILQKYLN
jgi:transposase